MPSIRRLCAIFFRVSNFTFGGGNPTTAALQRELVEKEKWLSEQDFALCYALARVTPGTNLFAFCTAAACRMLDWRVALIVLTVASAPACFITWAVTAGFDQVSANVWVAAGIAGALASSAGVLVASFWLLVRPALTPGNRLRATVIVGISIVFSMLANLSPIPVLLISGVAGWFWKEREA